MILLLAVLQMIKVFNTIELFFDHLIDKEEAIRRLRFEKPNLQLCFRTQKSSGILFVL